MTPRELLDELFVDVRCHLVQANELLPVPVPDAFAIRDGSWNGRPLRMLTTLWGSAGPLARVHLARVESESDAMTSFTLLALPRPDLQAPILGVDIVAFSGVVTAAILDVCPAPTPLDARVEDAVAAARDAVLAVSETRRWREPSPSPFSEHVIFVQPSQAALPFLQIAWKTYLEAFTVCLRSAKRSDDPDPGRLMQSNYLERIGESKKQMKALAHLFGSEWIRPYFDEVFFNAGQIA